MTMLNTVSDFFNSFEMDYDRREGHSYKAYIKSAVIEFLQDNSKDNAFCVYQTFLDCYRMKLQGNKNFIDLLDTLKHYEENAATLLDKQRDHYIHSVNVFLLGIDIFQSNQKLQAAFGGYFDRNQYTGMFGSCQEEFVFQWGLASLFHDIGYPMEITNNQLQKFVKFVVEADKKEDAKPFIGFLNFEQLDQVPISEDKIKDYIMLDMEHFSNRSTIDLICYSIQKDFLVSYEEIKKALGTYVEKMQNSGFVDHGFYSAVILLHWYGHLTEKCGMSPEVLYHPVVNAASAILLHNYYKNVLQKEPFHLKQMSVKDQPVAYLLILCDELQEWNREAYGILDKQRVLAADCRIDVDEESISVHYITYQGTLSEDFASLKKELFQKLLNLEEVFADSINITCTTKTEQYIDRIVKKESILLPRPFIENIEQLAKLVHENYNKTQLERYPDKKLEYPDWDSLPDTLKYSNIRQARSYFDKLKKLGYMALPQGQGEAEITSFTQEQIELLARDEHDSWFEERKQNGWVYGKEKNTDLKISPYMIPYDELSEEIKELDRDAVRNIIPLLNSVGLKIYGKEA